MKKLTKITLNFLGTFIVVATCAFTTLDFYSKDKIEKHVNEYTKTACAYGFENDLPQTMNLAELLYGNIHVNAGTLAGQNTPQSYRDGWRKIIADHPEYVHAGVSLYGKYFMAEYKSNIDNYYKRLLSPDAKWKIPPHLEEDTLFTNYIKLDIEGGGTSYIPQSSATSEEKELAVTQKKKRQQEYIEWWHKDSVEFVKKLKTFSISNYWKEQREIFSKYQLLIKKMLLLDDKTLNAYVKSMNDQNNLQAMKPLQTWLYNQKLISLMPKLDANGTYSGTSHETWYCWFYPCDFVFLTHRICRDYPKQWTPRKFLMEADKFAGEIEPLLPK